MTVAIGLVCSDGVLVASDSMASAGQTAFPMCKVHACPDLSMVWTAAGSVYVAEEIENRIAELSKNGSIRKGVASGDLGVIRNQFAASIRTKMHECYSSALPFGINQVMSQQHHPFISDFLFMGWANEKPWFLELAQDGQMNWHTSAGFAAVGSGGPFASVAQALMAHYLEGGPVPADDGVLLAHRAIATTCDVSSAYVGPPVWIATATNNGARVLDAADISEIATAVDGWKRVEQDTFASLRAKAEPESVGGIDDLPAFKVSSDNLS